MSGRPPDPHTQPETGRVHLPRGARFKRLLLAGLLILVPAALTVYVLVLVFKALDGIFGPFINEVLERAIRIFRPDAALPEHLPGPGLVMTLLVILLLGWLSTNVVGRRLLRAMEKVIERIPVAKTIYSATKGILEAVSQDQAEAFKRVVLIEYPKQHIYALAFVTGGARWGQLGEHTADLLLVFVPTTPNPTSGFLLLVPRGEAIELPITVEEGIRMVISGGVLLPKLRPAPAAPAGPDPRPDPAAALAEVSREELA